MDVSSDGGLLAVSTQIGVYVLRLDTLEIVSGYQTSFWATDLSFSPDGTQLAVAAGDLFIFESTTGEPLMTITHEGDQRIDTVEWSPSCAACDRTFLAGFASGQLTIWDAVTGEVERSFSGGDDTVLAPAWSPDGTRLALGLMGGRMAFWDALAGEVEHGAESTEYPYSLVFTPDDSRLLRIIANGDSALHEVNLETGEVIRAISAPSDCLSCFTSEFALSLDGTLFATAYSQTTGTLVIWDMASGRPVREIEETRQEIVDLGWIPGGYQGHTQALAGISMDGAIVIVDAETGEKLARVDGYKASAVAWSPDGATLATSAGDNVAFWDVASGDLLRIKDGRPGYYFNGSYFEGVSGLTWRPDGTLVASGPVDAEHVTGQIIFWDVETGSTLLNLAGGALFGVPMFSPDGTLVAATDYAQSPFVWDAATGKLVGRLDEAASADSVAWSPDGARVMASGWGNPDFFVRVFDGQTLEHLLSINGPTLHPAWSPDGAHIAAPLDSQVGIWNASTGQLVSTLEGLDDTLIKIVAWSPDGKRLVAGTDRDQLVVWDAQSQQRRMILKGHNFLIRHLSWSPDGKLLLSGSLDGTMVLWDMNFE